MRDILKKWYQGLLYPCEEIDPNDYRYRAALARFEINYGQFLETLSAEQRQDLEKLSKNSLYIANTDSYSNFSYGFRLGATLMCETLLP